MTRISVIVSLLVLSLAAGAHAMRVPMPFTSSHNRTMLQQDPLTTFKEEVTKAAASYSLDMKGYPSMTLPAAANTSCGAGVVEQLASCCSDRDIASFSGAQMSGTLPNTTRPANNLTDLSNNPALCGLISTLPAAGAVHSQTSPFILYNSNVQLDLQALGSQDPTFGPYMVMWLGQETALAPNNLAGALPGTQAYQACSLLQHGSLVVLDGRYCRVGSQEGCTCDPTGLKTFSYAKEANAWMYFASADKWQNCHNKSLQLSFANQIVQDRALAVYDAHMAKQDPALACGDCIGRKYRATVLGITWAVSWSVSLAVVALFCLYECYSNCSESGDWSHISAVLIFLGINLYDIITNWLYVQSIGRAGNAKGYLLNMWLLLVPCVLCGAAGVVINGARLVCGCSGGCKKQCYTLVAGLLCLASLLAATLVPGLITHNILTYCVDGVLCPFDIIAMTQKMIYSICYTQAVVLLLAVVCKVSYYWDWDDTVCSDNCQLWPLIPDIYFLLLQSIPQLGVQTWLWVEGEAMVSTSTFVVSSVGSVVGVVYCVTDMVVVAHSIGANRAGVQL